MKVHFRLEAYNEQEETIDCEVCEEGTKNLSYTITRWKRWAPCICIMMVMIDEDYNILQAQYWLRKGTKWVHKYIDTKED